ncbi:MAG TPA: PIG-L family deacetylase, partial [Acidimicrobiales bacterium]|nr:PIG-L family deacetylase [Acidimicrobiales bacterium]
ASSTGGLFRQLANEGVRTVLVTCTNGECGDALDGAKPDADHHDGDVVAAMRAVELDRAVAILGIDRLVRLGYRDSGMMGWPQNKDVDSFWATPVDVAAQKLATVLREERPQVVMTYNAVGFYGHPDHIQAHRVTLAAIALLDYEPTLYFNAVPESIMVTWRARWAEEERLQREADLAAGRAVEEEAELLTEEGEPLNMATPDDEVSVRVDVRAVADAKFDALAAHASQISESFWMKMGRERFRDEMRYEWFVRATNPLGLSGSAEDIFVGYR